MTAKEKAIELYNKFRNENTALSANIRAKKQSLICIDEMIELSILSVATYLGEIYKNEDAGLTAYLKQVKQEIELL